MHRTTLLLIIGITVVVNVAAVDYWHEYFRTLGHPER